MVRKYSGLCTGTQVTSVSPSGLAWEAFCKVTLIAPRVASEVMVKSWTSVRDAIRSTLVRLHPTLVVELGGTSKAPASVRDRLSPSREGKLWWRVYLHSYLEQEKMLPVGGKKK